MSHTNKDLLKIHERFCEKARAVVEKKNQDYGGGLDAYANFKGSQAFGVSPVIGILLRVQDKMMRIKTYADTGALLVKDESVEDAIIDIMNYMIIMAGYILDEKEQAQLKQARKDSEREAIVTEATNGHKKEVSLEEAYQKIREFISEEEKIQLRINAFGWSLVDSELKGKPIKILTIPEDSQYYKIADNDVGYGYIRLNDILYPSCT